MTAPATGADGLGSLRFARAVRNVAAEAHGLGLTVPGFRTPPRRLDADRTLRRTSDGTCTVAVRVRGRPWPAVLADVVEGVVVVNDLRGTGAARVRDALWAALEVDQSTTATVGGPARVA